MPTPFFTTRNHPADMRKARVILFFCVALFVWAITPGCKTPKLEDGGAYAQTNAVGEVTYRDSTLFVADSAYKFAYDSIQAVMRFERDNRVELWKVSPQIKKGLDVARPKVVDIEKRWAVARRSYRMNPTPEGLTNIQAILAEMQRILPIVQAQLANKTN